MENNGQKFGKVMLIDDNEIDNFISKKIINAVKFSHDVVEMSSAIAAIEYLNELMSRGKEAAAEFPDVFFIDLNMPVLNGFEFIDFLYARCTAFIGKSKLVILTSSIHDEDKRRAQLLSDHILYMNKPLTAEKLKHIPAEVQL